MNGGIFIKTGNKERWILTLMIISTLISFSSCKNNTTESADNVNQNNISYQSETAVNCPYDSNDCIGLDYSAIEDDFKTSGFTNVRLESIEDLITSESDKINTVESISINGNYDFTKEQIFNKNDEIVIRYHVYKNAMLN